MFYTATMIYNCVIEMGGFHSETDTKLAVRLLFVTGHCRLSLIQGAAHHSVGHDSVMPELLSFDLRLQSLQRLC